MILGPSVQSIAHHAIFRPPRRRTDVESVMASVGPMARPIGSPGLDELERWICTPPRADDPVAANRRWLCSTAADLSGPVDGPRRPAPDGLVQGVDVLASALAASGGPSVDGPALVGARASAAGLGRSGATSVGGNAHLREAADGMICLNLARPEDFDALPALVGPEAGGPLLDPTDWPAVRRALAGRTRSELVEAADLLGLPLGVPGTAPSRPLVASIGPLRSERPAQPVVVEFGSLWAAPLCGGLLARAGCRVVKVESVHRPDGARRGPASFFASLNSAKEEVTVDPTTKAGLEQVRRLVDGADVVLEASRPRALAHWGLDAQAEVARGVVWASITGYGRTGQRSGGVAFGDDAAVSGGLVFDEPRGFVADAVADPVTGMLAAVAVRAALDDGVGALLDLSLAGTAAWLAGST